MIHHTRVEDAEVHPSGWYPLTDTIEVTRLPVVDRANRLPDGTPLFARLNYDEALEVAKREGARLIGVAELEEIRRVGVQLVPYLGTPTAENDIVHSMRHDSDIWRQLAALGWTGGPPVCGAGKHWLDGAPAGKSRLGGWDKDGPGPRLDWWQKPTVAHNRLHFDDGTTTVLARARKVEGNGPGLGSRLLGAGRRLVDALASLIPKPAPKAPPMPTKPAADPRAPACVAALRDANARWPGRKKASDGIMGDAAHQKRPSDHNLGNAVDITHDPASGCDGQVIADLAIQDPRVTYVIWNAQIYNRARAAEGWRPYKGSNPHRHHVHISVRADARGDASRWGWAP